MPEPEHRQDCHRLAIDEYELQEVILPQKELDEPRTAIRVLIRGRNFSAMGQPLIALVGGVPLRDLRIAVDERSVEGVLVDEPEPGGAVEVMLGDIDEARHPTPFEPEMVKRIGRGGRR